MNKLRKIIIGLTVLILGIIFTVHWTGISWWKVLVLYNLFGGALNISNSIAKED